MTTHSHSAPPTVGIVGGGQLARMMAQAAIALGINLRLLAQPGETSAPSVIGDTTIVADYDLSALREFTTTCDVLTFDHEHVPPDQLRALIAEGVAVRPGPEALIHAQDKQVLRRRLDELGTPQPVWAPAPDLKSVTTFAATHGWPVILKTARGGYDGKGVWRVNDAQQLATVWSEAAATGHPLLVEQHIAFGRELAAQVVRRPSGQLVAYPVVETVQQQGICWQVTAPAAGTTGEAEQIARHIAQELEVTGMLTVECFETTDGQILVNELAMRPHNSGHWTIDGANVSQFEHHLRAVLDWPLTPVHPTAARSVMVNLLGGPCENMTKVLPQVWQDDPEVHVHLYGKTVKPGRKVGHVTVCGDETEKITTRAQHAAATLTGRLSQQDE